jgi:hypothetical protein
MLDEVSDARRSAVDRSPALERCVFASFEAGQLRYDGHSHFNIETQVRAILKHDPDGASVIRGSGFDIMNGLPLELSERGMP